MDAFNRVKQKALEKIGKAERTFETEELEQAAVVLKIMKANYTKVDEKIRFYRERNAKLTMDLLALTSALESFAMIFLDDNDARIHESLRKVSEVNGEITRLQDMLNSAYEQYMETPIMSILQMDVPILEQLHEAEKKARLDYDAKLSLLKNSSNYSKHAALQGSNDSSTTSDFKIQLMQESVQAAKKDYNLFASSFLQKVSGKGGLSRLRMLKALANYLKAQKAYFAEGYAILMELDEFLNQLDSCLKDNYTDGLDQLTIA